MSAEKRDFNKVAAKWDEEPKRVKLAGDVARAIGEEVKLTPEMDVLDFGCGTGLLALNLQPHVRSITGVDSSQGMLDVLKADMEFVEKVCDRVAYMKGGKLVAMGTPDEVLPAIKGN